MGSMTSSKKYETKQHSFAKEVAKTATKQHAPLDLRLHAEFGISLGNKLFKNE
jgi:hypothetical protein